MSAERDDDRSLGQRCHDALLRAARAKSEAERLAKLAKRVLAQCFIHAVGRSAAERDAIARNDVQYIRVEDALIEAETAANLARAEADGLELRFEEWRTTQATARAEMNLR